MIVPRYVTNAYDISHVVLWVSSLLVSYLFFPHTVSKQLHLKQMLKNLSSINSGVLFSGRTQQANSSTTQWPFQQHHILLPSIKPRSLVGESLFFFLLKVDVESNSDCVTWTSLLWSSLIQSQRRRRIFVFENNHDYKHESWQLSRELKYITHPEGSMYNSNTMLTWLSRAHGSSPHSDRGRRPSSSIFLGSFLNLGGCRAWRGYLVQI